MGLDGNMPVMNMDQIQYMAPMDLYESIWGGTFMLLFLFDPLFPWILVADIFSESPDPWNSGGMDSMNYDFLAQPPPGQPQQQFYF